VGWFSFRGVRKVVAAVYKELKADADRINGHLKEAMVPYDVKVERRVATSLSRIAATDRETELWLKEREEELKRIDLQAKQSKVETRRRKVQLEVRQAATEVVRADEERVKGEQRRQRIEQFQAQRKAESEARWDVVRKEEEAEKKALADEIERVRRWRMRHWRKVAVDHQQEAKVRDPGF
jgi:hypothetical protein